MGADWQCTGIHLALLPKQDLVAVLCTQVPQSHIAVLARSRDDIKATDATFSPVNISNKISCAFKSSSSVELAVFVGAEDLYNFSNRCRETETSAIETSKHSWPGRDLVLVPA